MENYKDLLTILECTNSTYDEIKYDEFKYFRKLCVEFCGNKTAATGMWNALRREGIRCIEDLRITSIEKIEGSYHIGQGRFECVKNMKAFLE